MLSIDDNIWSIHLNVHNMLHCLIVFWRLEITSFKDFQSKPSGLSHSFLFSLPLMASQSWRF